MNKVLESPLTDLEWAQLRQRVKDNVQRVAKELGPDYLLYNYNPVSRVIQEAPREVCDVLDPDQMIDYMEFLPSKVQ